MPVHNVDPAFLGRMLTAGGDRRIWVPAGSDVNLYGASPFPREMLGFASSTANDISLGAFEYLHGVVGKWAPGQGLDGGRYATALDVLRQKIRAAYALDNSVDIVRNGGIAMPQHLRFFPKIGRHAELRIVIAV